MNATSLANRRRRRSKLTQTSSSQLDQSKTGFDIDTHKIGETESEDVQVVVAISMPSPYSKKMVCGKGELPYELNIGVMTTHCRLS